MRRLADAWLAGWLVSGAATMMCWLSRQQGVGWLESGDVIVAAASGVLRDDWESGVRVATLICWQLAAHL